MNIQLVLIPHDQERMSLKGDTNENIRKEKKIILEKEKKFVPAELFF